MNKTTRRIASVPVSAALAVLAYFAFAAAYPDSDAGQIMGVGVFVTSMIVFFGGMGRPVRR